MVPVRLQPGPASHIFCYPEGTEPPLGWSISGQQNQCWLQERLIPTDVKEWLSANLHTYTHLAFAKTFIESTKSACGSSPLSIFSLISAPPVWSVRQFFSLYFIKQKMSNKKYGKWSPLEFIVSFCLLWRLMTLQRARKLGYLFCKLNPSNVYLNSLIFKWRIVLIIPRTLSTPLLARFFNFLKRKKFHP